MGNNDPEVFLRKMPGFSSQKAQPTPKNTIVVLIIIRVTRLIQI
jgi:hypothetical protein